MSNQDKNYFNNYNTSLSNELFMLKDAKLSIQMNNKK
jgi:hypothetical protein